STSALSGFEDRMKDRRKGVNSGVFITGADIDRRQPTSVTQLFRDIPSLHVVRVSSSRDEFIVAGRVLASLPAQRATASGMRTMARVDASYCALTVYLDGVKLNQQRFDGGGRDTAHVSIDDLTQVNSVGGIEIYSRIA